MGSGRFDRDDYARSSSTRASSGVDDFAYSKSNPKAVHKLLDPKRINGKPFGMLESRDSKEHPNSNAVVVSFDVTGSNASRAVIAQKKLPNLMDLLEKYLDDPQVLVAANDDFYVQPDMCIQISDFESDNRIDEAIRSIVLVGDGGGNHQESYDLMMYAIAKKTVIDCFEKRNRKGYFFMYADEPIPTHLQSSEVRHVFGDDAEGKLSIAAVIKELKRRYHVYVLWPRGGFIDAREQYKSLFGDECVVELQDPNLICEMIGSLVGLREEKADKHGISSDLVHAGVSPHDAKEVLKALPAHVR